MVSKRAIRRDTLSGDFGRAVRPAHSSIFFGVVNNLKSNAACAPRIRNGGITGSRMLLTPASVERGCCSNETRVALAIPGSQTNSTECHSPSAPSCCSSTRPFGCLWPDTKRVQHAVIRVGRGYLERIDRAHRHHPSRAHDRFSVITPGTRKLLRLPDYPSMLSSSRKSKEELDAREGHAGRRPRRLVRTAGRLPRRGRARAV